MTCVLHVLCGLSIDHCAFVLSCLQILLRLSISASDNVHAASILRALPQDVRTVANILSLMPQATAYVCCPKCFAMYPIEPSDSTSYPERCSNKDAPDSPQCGRRLRTPSNNPSREFLYHGLDHWVAKLHGSQKLEDAIDTERTPPLNTKDHPMNDMWDATGLYKIEGHDGRPFYRKSGSESRIVVGLNIDGLNALGNKMAGKKHSVMGIYLVCLNLPRAIRYDLENMFLVGILPGPDEPSRHQINHVLHPLVNDLLRLWKDGVFLTWTARYPMGRRVRVALGPLICDLPAACQVSGFTGHSATSFCHQCHQTLADKHDLAYERWHLRDGQSHRESAEWWRAAETASDREEISNAEGLRYSELLRLPYWDPIKFTVIDSMHCFYLRLLNRHCREIWGMNAKVADGPGITFDNLEVLSNEEKAEARHILRTGSDSKLEKL